MNSTNLIRTIYLYLFSLIGLVILISGIIGFLDMGLKMYVFTKADQSSKYVQAPINLDGTTSAEKVIGEVDYVTSSRHRDAARNLAMMLVGLPLYIYHWRIIKKEKNIINN